MKFRNESLALATHLAYFPKHNTVAVCFNEKHVEEVKAQGARYILKGLKREGAQPFGLARVKRVAFVMGMDAEKMQFMHASQFLISSEAKLARKVEQAPAMPQPVERKLPARVYSGVGRGKLSVPQSHGVFDPKDFPYHRIHADQYQKLTKLLDRYHLKLDIMGVSKIPSVYRGVPQPGSFNTNFMAFAGLYSEDQPPLFIWHRYCGASPEGGTCFVYVGGRKFKATEFMAKIDDEAYMNDVFGPVLLKAWVNQ